MPTTTDYGVNDAAGESLLVVTAEANTCRAMMLPPPCKDIRAPPASAADDRARPGGWSRRYSGG